MQTRTQAHRAGFHDKRRCHDGGGEVCEAAAEAVVERFLEILLGAMRGVAEQLFDIGVERDRGSHPSIMMPSDCMAEVSGANALGPMSKRKEAKARGNFAGNFFFGIDLGPVTSWRSIGG